MYRIEVTYCEYKAEPDFISKESNQFPYKKDAKAMIDKVCDDLTNKYSDGYTYRTSHDMTVFVIADDIPHRHDNRYYRDQYYTFTIKEIHEKT